MLSFAKKMDSLDILDRYGADSLYKLAKNSLGAPDTSSWNSFGQEDFYADIDARNISSLINGGLLSYFCGCR
ncbi:MAG: hypothetical protein HUK20_14120 [Fibrobacter sp.]|nr:hypothetical protein [Fibrobacter sp.]